MKIFVCEFLCVLEARRVGGVVEFGEVREVFLIPITLFELYGKGLLGSQEDWHPPGVGRLISELWVWGGFVEMIRYFLSPDALFRFSGLGLLVGI